MTLKDISLVSPVSSFLFCLTGRGQRLVPGNPEDPGVEANEEAEGEEEPPQIPNGTVSLILL